MQPERTDKSGPFVLIVDQLGYSLSITRVHGLDQLFFCFGPRLETTEQSGRLSVGCLHVDGEIKL